MFRKRNSCYDIDFLREQDLSNTKPNFEKLERLSPLLAKDKAFAYSLFSVQQDIPIEVQEYYKEKAKKATEQENLKYSHLLEVMETKVYL